MSSRSIVDRVLLVAAALCAAGLAWQITVLITSKAPAPSFHKMEAAAAPAPASALSDQPVPRKETPAVRVVYSDGVSNKTTGKATDAVPAPPGATAAPAAPPQTLSPAPAVASAPPPAPAAATSPAASTSSAPAAVALAPDAALDPIPPKAADGLSPSTDAKAEGAAGIDINRASIEALNHLQGAGRIGQAIASHRPYHSIEDLLKKRVVRRSVYDQIKSQLAAE